MMVTTVWLSAMADLVFHSRSKLLEIEGGFIIFIFTAMSRVSEPPLHSSLPLPLPPPPPPPAPHQTNKRAIFVCVYIYIFAAVFVVILVIEWVLSISSTIIRLGLTMICKQIGCQSSLGYLACVCKLMLCWKKGQDNILCCVFLFFCEF